MKKEMISSVRKAPKKSRDLVAYLPTYLSTSTGFEPPK
jgi:hypothetical protein